VPIQRQQHGHLPASLTGKAVDLVEALEAAAQGGRRRVRGVLHQRIDDGFDAVRDEAVAKHVEVRRFLVIGV
jgi:hypothetical protein